MQLFNRPGRRMLIIAAAALACTAAALLPIMAQASPASRAAPQVARCTASNTYVWFALSPSGAAGTIYYPIEFTNLGSRTCWLSGFPRVWGISKSGRKLGPEAGRLIMTPRRVLLRHNQTVHALVGIVEPGIIAGCHAVTAAGFAVYPPGQVHKQLIEDFSFSACSNKVYMHVLPVQAGIGVP